MKLAIIDFNRTIYDPQTKELVDGARKLLEHLASRDVRMVLLSQNDKNGGRMKALEQLGVKAFFAETAFVALKNVDAIEGIMARHGATPGDTFVVGDYMYEDVRAGNQAGAFTIQYKQGAYADSLPQVPEDVPKAVITRLIDAASYIV